LLDPIMIISIDCTKVLVKSIHTLESQRNQPHLQRRLNNFQIEMYLHKTKQKVKRLSLLFILQKVYLYHASSQLYP
jgi:hypothetical protein